MKKSILITGGAGFIGSHIAVALVERGYSVRVLDNLSTGRRENLGAVEGEIQFIEADINDASAVRRAVAGVDCIFHQAALASVPLSLEQPLQTHAACATGTLCLLDQARQCDVRRFVYAASSSAYGDQSYVSMRETDTPAPMSPYGAAKLAGEHYCQAFYHSFGLETVGLRYFNVFGPRQDPDSPYSAVIPLFIRAMLRGDRPILYGDGRQTRDFTYVGNVVQGNLLAMQADGAAGRTLNLATGRSTDLITLIAKLAEVLGIEATPLHQDPRPGDIRDSLADITLARKLLGYAPTIGLEEGLERSLAYYRSLYEPSG
jgi:UDP-glucose 4-epimerase